MHLDQYKLLLREEGLNLFLRQPALGDVGRVRKVQDDLPRVVLDGIGRRIIIQGPVRKGDFDLHRLALPGREHPLRHFETHVGQILRIDVPKGLSDEIIGLLPESTRKNGVGKLVPAVFVDAKNRRARGLDERTVFQFAFPQRILHPLPFGNILEDRTKLRYRAVGICHNARRQQNIDERAVLAPIFLLKGNRDLFLENGVEPGKFPFQVLGRRKVLPGTPEQFIPGAAEHLAQLVIDMEPSAVGIVDRRAHYFGIEK